MRIFNVQVYGIIQSMVRSGYPMQTEIKHMPQMNGWAPKYDEERSIKLGNANQGSGHDNFLSGIIVQADIEAPGYWWPQWQRYHFQQIVSSQSKMHRAHKFKVADRCCEFVDSDTIVLAQSKVDRYNSIENPSNEDFERMIANLPQGLELTAGISTNYLQLKTMYSQRRNHRLKMWRAVFVPWVEGLPMFKELVLGGESNS